MATMTKTKIPTTEADLQAVLIRRALRLYKHQCACANTGVYGWDADVLTTTRAGLVHEYEIKVSRSDWLAENRFIRGEKRGIKTRRADDLRNRRTDAPNYFWLAVTANVLSPEEAPEYAGVIIVHWLTLNGVEVRRNAPRLHAERMPDRVRTGIERGVALRYSDQLWENV